MRIAAMAVFTLGLVLLSAGAYAYDFWGVIASTESYAGGDQLAFDGVSGTSIQCVVGGYEYTRVDSAWHRSTAAYPGPSYSIHRKADAQGLFFLPDADAMRFVIITGAPQTGIGAPECGYGARLFGPGDLKIDVSGHTYGIGLRVDGLTWAINPSTTDPRFRIHGAEGGFESIYARDAGTTGRVELDPHWAHTGHSELTPGEAAAYAFYVQGSGTLAGSATVNFEDTGLSLSGAPVYAYEVTIPWATLGMDPNNYSFSASWRPDCGSDLLIANFEAVPEPGGLLAIATGLIGIAGCVRHK